MVGSETPRYLSDGDLFIPETRPFVNTFAKLPHPPSKLRMHAHGTRRHSLEVCGVFRHAYSEGTACSSSTLSKFASYSESVK